MISPCGCVSVENQRNIGWVSAENARKTGCVCVANWPQIGVVSVFSQFNEIYDVLPGQLGKENKRFVMNALKENARYESFANDFAWLTQSDAALKATCAALRSSCWIGAEWDKRRGAGAKAGGCSFALNRNRNCELSFAICPQPALCRAHKRTGVFGAQSPSAK
jgi:hypothetical protein